MRQCAALGLTHREIAVLESFKCFLSQVCTVACVCVCVDRGARVLPVPPLAGLQTRVCTAVLERAAILMVLLWLARREVAELGVRWRCLFVDSRGPFVVILYYIISYCIQHYV